MDDKYSIKNLIDIFQKHSEEFLEMRQGTLNEDEYFNISKALLVICQEINSLKNENRNTY